MTNILNENEIKKRDKRIIFICWLAYTAAYVGRLNYSASIVSIVDELGIAKADAGLVSSFFFFAYGAGQLVNGILSKRYNSKIMIFSSLAVSSVLNLIMPLCGDISVMKFIWMFNGMAQSVLWSTLIKTLSDLVSEKMLPKAILMMSTTVAVGTFVSYGISALCINFGSWKNVFYIASVVLMLSAVVWISLYGKGNYKKVEIENTEKGDKIKMGKGIIIALAVNALAGVANGFIKDGINTWVPSVLYEEFRISQSFSILLTLLLPLISTFGAAIIRKVHEKIKSHAIMNSIIFALSALLCGGILISMKYHNLFSVMLCFICVACCMAMINNVITSMFALDNRTLLNAGFAAGLLNTFCYVGSTVTSYSLGAVSQSSGWNTVFIIMLTVCAAVSVICFVGNKIQKRAEK